ncbi:MAG: type II toxin-antitoxin system Phd/YefM family antitoxin [Gemmatimonadetes bacterium]|nr:type II toxin-antitoxin system Phd/YefM family antitoxin [Gemmatimonadota bacterium]
MKVFTDSEAEQNLSSVLDKASREGSVRFRRTDGQSFILKPEVRPASPLAIKSMDLGFTREEIASFVREGRDRPE